MVYIYVIKLQQNKYYVGKTNNPQFRLENHFSSQGAEWTRLYKPVSLEALIPDCDDYDEDKYTRMYMDKYGVDNVRGGSYTQVVLGKSSKEQLTKMSNGTNDRCFTCGKQGHFAKDCTSNKWCCSICSMNFDTKSACIKHEYSCKKKSTVYFTYVDSDSDEDCYVYGNKYKKSKCFRCGREGHYSSSCYASTHAKGYYLNEYR
jgi:predicted GIY-YIG superfamily endonuclease